VCSTADNATSHGRARLNKTWIVASGVSGAILDARHDLHRRIVRRQKKESQLTGMGVFTGILLALVLALACVRGCCLVRPRDCTRRECPWLFKKPWLQRTWPLFGDSIKEVEHGLIFDDVSLDERRSRGSLLGQREPPSESEMHVTAAIPSEHLM
jgi:hypothetical protein